MGPIARAHLPAVPAVGGEPVETAATLVRSDMARTATPETLAETGIRAEPLIPVRREATRTAPRQGMGTPSAWPAVTAAARAVVGPAAMAAAAAEEEEEEEGAEAAVQPGWPGVSVRAGTVGTAAPADRAEMDNLGGSAARAETAAEVAARLSFAVSRSSSVASCSSRVRAALTGLPEE